MAAQSGATEVWDVSSWKVQQQFAASSAVYFLAISLDNHLLAGATDYDTEIWNLPTQRRLAVLHAPFDCYCLNSLAFSPDGTMLASADGDTAIRIYDAHTGVLRATATDLLLESFALDFSPDGKSLLVGGADRAISVIDPMNGKIVRALPKQSGVPKALLLSPDGKQAAAMYPLPDRFIQLSVVLVWDLSAQTVRARFEKPGVFVVGGAFAGDRFLLLGIPAASSAYGPLHFDSRGMSCNTLPLSVWHLHPRIGPALIFIKRLTRFIGPLAFEATGRDGRIAKHGNLQIVVLRTVVFGRFRPC